VNDIFVSLGIESWKPTLSSLLVSPLPLIVLVVVGALLMNRHRVFAWLLIGSGCIALWLATTRAAGMLLMLHLLQPPPALTAPEIADLAHAPLTAIVVLGGGRRSLAPEYGTSTLTPRTMERLRYGIWLARATELPVAFSGGVGWAARPGPSEADVAHRIADREFGFQVRWREGESRDTHENAVNTIALLHPIGIEQIVLVTHDSDMPRAVANFERASSGTNIRIVAAPMDVPTFEGLRAQDWLPSSGGYEQVWGVLHEWIGILAGA